YSGYHPYTLKKVKTPITRKEKDEQHRFFFWYKDENKAWIKKTLNRLGRTDLLNVLLPEKTEKWRKNKPSGDAKHTFDDAVPFNQRRDKVKYKGRKHKKRR
ncbi:MAG: YgiQ family radical SAM protein, partial [Psychroserpens sp.]